MNTNENSIHSFTEGADNQIIAIGKLETEIPCDIFDEVLSTVTPEQKKHVEYQIEKINAIHDALTSYKNKLKEEIRRKIRALHLSGEADKEKSRVLIQAYQEDIRLVDEIKL